jgi:hypothetical protein
MESFADKEKRIWLDTYNQGVDVFDKFGANQPIHNESLLQAKASHASQKIRKVN